MKKLIIFLSILIFVGCSTLPDYIESQSVMDANDTMQRAQDAEEEGLYTQALHLYENAFDLYSGVDNIKGIIISGIAIVRQYYYLEDMQTYQQWLTKIDTIIESEHSNLMVLKVLLMMEVAFDQEDYSQVLMLSKLAQTDNKEYNTEVQCYRLLSLLKSDQSYEEEFEIIDKNLGSLKRMFNKNKLNDPKIVSYAAYTLGYALSRQQKWLDAIEYFEEAHHYDQLIENESGLADDVYVMGICYQNLGDKERALSAFIRAKEMYENLLDEGMSAAAQQKIDSLTK
ncbi:MAG TPA: tetratricopeptide repeat protein [Candidatus Cloacimonetes bacterium]|nr:tetratricopeptide repeat protein [Candidatus Cloacimonadota bacterium]HEX38043.1 tetratricopeptide repeat protein [Candidatus Cloacimonadota bacterium]